MKHFSFLKKKLEIAKLTKMVPEVLIFEAFFLCW